MTFSVKAKAKVSRLSRLGRRPVLAAALLAGTALAAPAAQAEPAGVRAAPVPDLVCRLDAEVNFSPPLWLHLIIWIPLAIVLCLWLLRVLKAILIALQYRNNARQGEIDRG